MNNSLESKIHKNIMISITQNQWLRQESNTTQQSEGQIIRNLINKEMNK